MNRILGPIAGVVLAGGKSLRMGRDKREATFGGESLLSRAIARARPQVAELAVASGNGDLPEPAHRELANVADPIADGGPLAGIVAGMGWAASRRCSRLATFAVDCPFLPRSLVARMGAVAELADPAAIVVAASAGRLHPVFALWPVSMAAEARAALDSGQRRVGAFQDSRDFVAVDFATDAVDPFFNVNTPEDLAAAEDLAGRAG